MPLLPLAKLGARETLPGILDFGLYLPGLTPKSGVQIDLKIVHEQDQFLQGFAPSLFPLVSTPDPDFPAADYWSVRVDTTKTPAGQALPKKSAWGKPGRYVFRYVVSPPNGPPIDFVVDPYAREFGVGDLSAITVGYTPYRWSANEALWKVPALNDLIVYEIMINEFGGDIDGVIGLLGYLQDLGVNCLEVMPVNNVKNTVNWGYDPFGYFGVDDRFGRRSDFQRLVDASHERGIAVVLDVVYGHTTGDFTFPYLYPKLPISNPFNGPVINDGGYGPKPDFWQQFTQDYFLTTNHIWLDTFHVDGFRYDNVPAFWDKTVPGNQYGKLIADTHALAVTQIGAAPANFWQRFAGPNGSLTLIQCAEYLDDPPAVLSSTLTNCAWQNGTLGAAKSCAAGDAGAIASLGLALGLQGYPASATVGGTTQAVTALQYIENHDHSRFLCEFGLEKRDDMLLWRGLETNWYRLQPYLIGLLTAKGIPLLWEGGEFLQSYFVPDTGNGRQLVFRPVDFSNFYGPFGKPLLDKVRRLIQIRSEGAQFRQGAHDFYNVDYYTGQGLLLFSRSLGKTFSLVALNFTGTAQTTTIQLPQPGTYREEIDGVNTLTNVAANVAISVTIPSNYGQIWTIS